MRTGFRVVIGVIGVAIGIGVGCDVVRADHTPAGEYRGSALNTTVNQRGDVVLDLYAIDPAGGHLRAYFAASNGLAGEAWLSGTLGRAGELELSGPLASFAMTIRGRVRGDSVDASYVLEGQKPQKGTFQVTYRSALPFAQDGRMQRLIGAWEVGGGMAAPTNPITGQTTGISFVDARHLDILPSGRFKHLHSHRNCSGPGALRCCREEAFLETGALEVEGNRVTLDVQDGGTIVKDGCAGGAIRQGPIRKEKTTFRWRLETAGNGTPSLCLQRDAGDTTCYAKQG